MKNSQFGHLLALLCALIWGVTFISTKVLLEFLTPLQILFARFYLGYIALWAMWPHLSPKYGAKAEILFALAGFLGTFVYFFMENVALQHTTASNVGVLVCLAPLFTALIGKVLNPHTRLSGKFFVGAAISFVGVFLIMLGGKGSLEINPFGDSLAIGAALFWALYSIVLKKLAVFHVPILLSTRTIFGYGLVFIGGSLICLDDFPKVSQFAYTAVWSNLLFLGFIACAACYSMWTLAVEKIGPDSAALYIYLVPVICTACAYVVLGEQLTLWTASGTLLVLGGLFLSQLDFKAFKGRQKTQAEAPDGAKDTQA